MSEAMKRLVKETWVDYFVDNKETLKRIDVAIIEEYVDAMNRLETDFDFQAELGIGI